MWIYWNNLDIVSHVLFHHYSMSISIFYINMSIFDFINILCRLSISSIFFVDFTNIICRLSISSLFYVDFINILCRFDCQFHQYSRSISSIFFVDFINILCRCHQYSMLILIAWRSTYTSTSFLTHSNPVFSNSNSDKSFSLPALIIFKVKIQSVHSNC